MMSQHSMSRYNPKRRPSKRRPSRRALRTLVALAVVAFLAAVPAVAQGGPGPGHGHHGGGHHAFGAAEAGFAHGLPGRHMGRLVRFLDLTADQKESAKALFESTRAEVEPIREAQRERHQELRTLLTEIEDRFVIVIDDEDVDGEMLETFGGLRDFVRAKCAAAA